MIVSKQFCKLYGCNIGLRTQRDSLPLEVYDMLDTEKTIKQGEFL